MNISISLPIIAYMHSPYREKFGIPRQPNLVNVQSKLKFCSPYDNLQAFEGLEHFSHLWLIWQFNENKNQQDNTHERTTFRPQIRPPRLGGNKKIGVFASRSMYRPAPIGLSVVKFIGLEKNQHGVWLTVEGADLLDGTPILDIKPYIQYSDSINHAVSAYAQDEPSRKKVYWDTIAQTKKNTLLQQKQVNARHFNELEQILSLDPRPAYQNDDQRIYKLKFANVDIQFKINAEQVEITDILLL